jgi:PST family polysaccharide transporter
MPDPAAARRARAHAKGYGKTAKVGALWHIGREWGGQLLQIPAAVILARLLTPADFGVAAAATFFIQLGKRIGNMGLNAALVRMNDVREEHRASVFVINVATGLLAWAVLMWSAPSIGAYYNDERVTGAVRVASTIFLVNFFGAVEFAVLQREMRFKDMAIVESMTPLLFLPVATVMAWSGWGYWSLIVAQVVANVGSTCAKVYFGRWKPSLRATKRGFAETVPFGMGMYAKRLLTYASQNLDSLIVGGLFGVTALGYYDKAFNTVENLTNRLSLGTTVMFRIFSIIQEERERFVRAYRKAVLTGTLITLPVFAGLMVAAREFIVVVFGPAWESSVLPFQLLCAAGALRFISDYASAAVQATGQVWNEVWRKVAQVLLIVVGILAFRSWGIVGAALGVVCATVVLAVLMQGLVRRIVDLSWREMASPFWPGLLAAAITAGAAATATWLVRSTSPLTPDWVVLILQCLAGGVAWGLFVLFGRFRTLQAVVDEVLVDIVPAPVRRPLERVRRWANGQEAESR